MIDLIVQTSRVCAFSLARVPSRAGAQTFLTECMYVGDLMCTPLVAMQSLHVIERVGIVYNVVTNMTPAPEFFLRRGCMIPGPFF